MPHQTVNFVFGNLNPCGGGERLTLVTMKAMLNMGINYFDLTTFYRPRISRLDQIFGIDLSTVMNKINKIQVIDFLEYLKRSNLVKKDLSKRSKRYSVTINTHGDKVPYFDPSFSKDNSIVYCHFPSAKHYIERQNLEYLEKELNIKVTNKIGAYKDYNEPGTPNHFNKRQIDRQRQIFELLKRAYDSMMKKSTVLTNSEFSRKAILESFESADVQVLSPPVDVECFRNHCLESDERQDIILVISRINSEKNIEKALRLARVLKKKAIGKRMIIIGSLVQRNFRYLYKLQKIARELEIKDYVTFQPNMDLESLLTIMRKAKVYFHPMVGEHFGISVVESMAAGLAPVVPSIGGPTEFVPQKFQFDSLDEAAYIVSSVLNLSATERRQISDSVLKFSSSNYLHSFQKLFEERFIRI
jgi:glycosyltransferase involved in cell wall biosynthesis